MTGDGDTKLARAEGSSGLLPFEDAGKHGTRRAIDLLHNVLTQLLADPDSAEPFNLVLAHILELSAAEAGAIFVSTESGRQFVLLACLGPDDRNRWMRVVRRCDLYRSEGSGAELEDFSDPEDPKSTILAQGFAQGACSHGLLLLRFVGDENDVRPPAAETLREYGEYLAGVLYSARCARLKLRNAQSEERAAIARELHDSLVAVGVLSENKGQPAAGHAAER